MRYKTLFSHHVNILLRRNLVRMLSIMVLIERVSCLAILLTTCLECKTYDLRCRSRNDEYMFPDEFALHSCIMCYEYMSNYTFKENARLFDLNFKVTQSNYSHYHRLVQDATVLATFQSFDGIHKWQECCENAENCCKEMLKNKTKKEQGWCPRTWDGWLCWSDSPPSTEQEKPCPIYSSSNMQSCTRAYARKYCDRDGNWSRYENDEREWTDYTPCSAKSVVELRLYLSLGFYSVSVITLLPAIFIFQKFRTLRCHRTILHKNLFASLLLHCCTEIVFNTVYALGELNEVLKIKRNDTDCILVAILTKYFRLTNYMWMFCEGFHLHRQIISVFVEETSLKLFYIIGWGLPVFPILIFVVLRKSLADQDCWALPSDYIDWALHLPCLTSLMINALFLVNIVRVLVTKLRSIHIDEPYQFRKAVKATLVLVPLFGVHFLVTIYRKSSVCSLAEECYVYTGYLVDGLQGFFVAVIFCFMNTEVLGLIRRKWRNIHENHSLNRFHSTYNGTSITSSTVVHTQTIL